MHTLRKAPSFYALALLHVAFFALFYLALWRENLAAVEGLARILWWIKVAIEILASFYFFSVILKSIDYLLAPSTDERAAPGEMPSADRRIDGAWPPVACVYLCAGDLDRRALESLCRLDYPGQYHVFVHDDSHDPLIAESVNATIEDLRLRTGHPVFVLRRVARQGGKPGAVNFALTCLARRYPFILLADSDSTAVDPRSLGRALPRLLGDVRVAAVQFRNVGVSASGGGRVAALLRRAIEVFDLFARHQARHGMPLFFGHNALLRTAALEDVGGLREGVFADDIDLSVRLTRRGWRIVYAREIAFGETHPTSYAAFRRRAYKWAYGCGQILRTHFVPFLLDPRVGFRQKAGLMDFIGFYAVQTVLLGYLILAGLVLPLVSSQLPLESPALLVSGTAVLVSIFLPTLVYHMRRGRISGWWPFALVCAVVYGSVAFTSAYGLLDGLRGRPRPWVPTNSGSRSTWLIPAVALEALFGAALFLVPAVLCPPILWQPSMYLFAAVFLSAPAVALLYTPRAQGPDPSRDPRNWRGNDRGSGRQGPLRRAVAFGAKLSPVCLVLVLAGSTVHVLPGGGAEQDGRLILERGRFVVDGRPFLIQGIHYSPWPPGTGPMKGHPWPDAAVIERDLETIRATGANTILVHDAPRSIVPLAARHGLKVIEAFFINWQSIGDDGAFRRRADEIVAGVRDIATEPNLLAVLLGNEVVEWVLEKRGAPFIEQRLRTLYQEVKQVAPHLPVSHANWPTTRNLDLSFMDFTAFNLYPDWPREVVVAGYGHYIESVLKPLARGRPLLISEFGQNSLETSEERQAQVLRKAWAEIRDRTAGGVVFAFADEWWKNYDNPISPEDYWKRAYAPEDEMTHDLDPEEYFGIVTAERAPKPAYAAVREMFAPKAASAARVSMYALPLVLLMGYTIFVMLRQRGE